MLKIEVWCICGNSCNVLFGNRYKRSVVVKNVELPGIDGFLSIPYNESGKLEERIQC